MNKPIIATSQKIPEKQINKITFDFQNAPTKWTFCECCLPHLLIPAMLLLSESLEFADINITKYIFQVWRSHKDTIKKFCE